MLSVMFSSPKIVLSWMIPLMVIVGGTVFYILYLLNKNKIGDVVINRNGVIVKSKCPKTIQTKQFVNFMKEIITYVENEKERYVDDVIGIKNRYFRQSQEFALSRIEEVENAIIQEYKVRYMDKYTGKGKYNLANSEKTFTPDIAPPTLIQVENDLDDCGKEKATSPCSKICSSGCNSGLVFFDSQIRKDFKPLLEEVFSIIEKNHLVNRQDREYEEEITTKAGQLSSHLKNKVVSYPVPIDNAIARKVIYEKTSEIKAAIEDALRRSRTLSKEKRAFIAKEKEKYYKRRDIQLSQIVNIIDDNELTELLKRPEDSYNDNDD